MKTIAVFFMVFMLSSCNLLRRDKVEVTNKTGYVLEDVEIKFADDSARRRSLGPGETFSFQPSPSHDGGISISYVEEGKAVKHDLGYVAPPISMKCEFQIVTGEVLGACH